ncbi:DUF4386 domain-containing protein [Actinoplanes hulinensis]|uniref:DUF4386 domain-containing protein n=1 Tax=Actinoplanes hulinensis TaxID=1144547 RepID=A0ABS7AY33_9ACTN|nr:DUF4386 domain-containing protein [Actinoplanes hulinensis]MBW6433653.1 DUF4386 domain-containing protein [Actinoplanes hulinensis]
MPSQRTARTTGALYLGLAISGMIGFLLLRPRLDDGAAVAGHPTLTHLVVLFELLIVLSQALTAAWIYRLFRTADPVSAAGVAAFGLANAVVILISAAMLGAAATTGPATTKTLFLISSNLWWAGAIFFGLWLVPMGTAVLNTGWMPRALGWVLIAGGAGYVLSALVKAVAPDAAAAADLLTVPASIGEFWIIGYLLIIGTRQGQSEEQRQSGGSPKANLIR